MVMIQRWHRVSIALDLTQDEDEIAKIRAYLVEDRRDLLSCEKEQTAAGLFCRFAFAVAFLKAEKRDFHHCQAPTANPSEVINEVFRQAYRLFADDIVPLYYGNDESILTTGWPEIEQWIAAAAGWSGLPIMPLSLSFPTVSASDSVGEMVSLLDHAFEAGDPLVCMACKIETLVIGLHNPDEQRKKFPCRCLYLDSLNEFDAAPIERYIRQKAWTQSRHDELRKPICCKTHKRALLEKLKGHKDLLRACNLSDD